MEATSHKSGEVQENSPETVTTLNSMTSPPVPGPASSPNNAPNLSKNNTSRRGKVKLNVGGKLFVTTFDTISRYPDSLLGRMFESRNMSLAQPEEDGSYFFDRNPKLFEAVLEFYRTGHVLYDLETVGYSVDALKTEFDYWGVPSPFPDDPVVVDKTEFIQKVSKISRNERIKTIDQNLYNLLLGETQKAVKNAAAQGRAYVILAFTSKGQTYFGGGSYGTDEYVIMNVIMKDFFHNPSNRILFIDDLRELGIRCSKRGVHRPPNGPGYGAEWRLELLIWDTLSADDFDNYELFKPQTIPMKL